MADRRVVLRFVGDTTSLKRSIGEAQAGMSSLAGRAHSLGNRLYAAGSRMQAIGFAASRLTIPAAIAGGAAVKMAVDWEDSLSKIERLAGVSQEHVRRWGDEILKLSPQIAVPPNELAEALYFVASSGAPVSEAMNIVRIAAKAASTGMGSTEVIADALTSTINVYGVENLNAARAADILTKAVIEGKGEAEDYARVVGRMTPIAADLGVEFEELGGAMSVMTNRGLSAAESATGIRQAMMSLVKPSKAAEKILAANGLSMEDIRKTVSEKGLLAGLRQMADVADGNREVMGKLFPRVRGLNAALMLTSKEGAAEIDATFQSVINSSGQLDASFAKAEETARFKLNKALSQLKTTGIEVGEALLPMVAQLAEWASSLAGRFTGLSDSQRKWIGISLLAAAGLGPLLRVLGNIAKVLSVFVNHPFLLVVIGLIALGKVLYDRWEPFRNIIDRIIEGFTKFVKQDAAKYIQQFTDWVKDHRAEIEKLIPTVGAFIGVFAGFMIFQQAKSMAMGLAAGIRAIGAAIMANPVGLIITGIALLVAGLVYAYTHFEGFRRVVDNVIDAVVNALGSAFEWFTENVLPVIISGFQYFRDEILPKVGDVLQNVAGTLMRIGEWIVTAGTAAWDAISDAARGFADWLDEHVMPILDELGELFSWVFDHIIEPIVSRVWPKISSIIGVAIQLIVITIRTALNIIVGVWTPVWNFIKEFVGIIWRTIVGIISGAWTIIKGVVEGALKVIRGIIQFITGVISGDWSKAWDGIKNIFSGIWNSLGSIVSGAWTIIKAVITGAWDGIFEFLRGVKDTIKEIAKGMWDGIKDAFKAALNWIIDRWNGLEFKVPSVNVFGKELGGFTLGVPDIPRLAKGGIVDKPTLALIGEGGASEVVFPTDNPERGFELLRQAGVLKEVSANRGKTVKIDQTIVALDPREAARIAGREMMRAMKSEAA